MSCEIPVACSGLHVQRSNAVPVSLHWFLFMTFSYCSSVYANAAVHHAEVSADKFFAGNSQALINMSSVFSC
jgi:hypothetical protein